MVWEKALFINFWKDFTVHVACLEDHPRMDVTVFNNHGDPLLSPKDRVVGPLTNGLFMAYNWG